jgi:FkbM family methyltransferase
MEPKAVPAAPPPAVRHHDQPLPLALRALINLPWPLKQWIAAEPRRWRALAGVCRRVGWNATRLGWHTAKNGPYRGLHLRATHVNHLRVPMGLYELWVSQWLACLLSDDRWKCRAKDVWDIGANVGIVSLLCARHGATRVVAFEPGEVNDGRLEAQANPLVAAGIEVISTAVSDVDGATELLAGDAGAEGQITSRGVQLWHDPHQVARVVTVKTIRLDSLLGEGRPGPGLLKIDVEGAEVLVLAGAHPLLRYPRPAIVLEVHNQDAYRACVDLLKAAGYAVREIVGRHLRDLYDEAISYGHLLAMPAEVEWPAERLRCLAF